MKEKKSKWILTNGIECWIIDENACGFSSKLDWWIIRGRKMEEIWRGGRNKEVKDKKKMRKI